MEPLKPFIAILIEVVVLVILILLYERMRAKKNTEGTQSVDVLVLNKLGLIIFKILNYFTQIFLCNLPLQLIYDIIRRNSDYCRAEELRVSVVDISFKCIFKFYSCLFYRYGVLRPQEDDKGAEGRTSVRQRKSQTANPEIKITAKYKKNKFSNALKQQVHSSSIICNNLHLLTLF